MNVTAKLLRLFRVDGQLRGLQTRLHGADRFLAEQTRLVEQIDAKRGAIEGQLRQLAASTANHEGEIARVDGRTAHLREQMNSAKTNKEYKAFLGELNTLKEERDGYETAALEQMKRSDELKAQHGALAVEREERERVRVVAADDRQKKAAEIKDRLAELKAERERVAAEVPPTALKVFEELTRQRGDAAMAPVEIQDRRRHEFTCGSCMMSQPVESVSALLSKGDLTRCASCGCVLFLEEDSVTAMQPTSSSKR